MDAEGSLTGDPDAVAAQTIDGHQRGLHHDCQAHQQNDAVAVALLALGGGAVHEEGCDHFHQRDGGGDGGDEHQQIEDDTEQGTDGTHGLEHVLQGDEQQAGAAQFDLVQGDAALDAVGHGGGNDCHAGHGGHDGVRHHDDGGVFHKVLFLIQIRAVSNHNAHGQGQREEHLAAGGGENGGKVGSLGDEARLHGVAGDKHELQAFHSAGQGQGADDDNDQHDEQGGHTHLVELLDAAGHAAPVDEVADDQEQQGEGHTAEGIGQHGAEQVGAGLDLRAGKGQVAQVQSHVLNAVAAQNRVEAHNDKGRKDCQPAYPFEFSGQVVVSANSALAGFAAHGQLAHHNDEAHEYRQQQVDQQEGKTAGLSHLVREAPDVAQAYGRADGRQQEADVASPRTSFIAHKKTSLPSKSLISNIRFLHV